MDEKVGVVIGRGREKDQLEIVVAFQEREKSPKLGEFLVIEETEFMRRKLLARVEEFSYGDFQATKDERIRALVEKYVREVTGVGRELSEEEKKALFFRHYILKVLGEIEIRKEVDPQTNEQKEIGRVKTDYRLLPELTSICRYPNPQEYKIITSAGLENAVRLLSIGDLSLGEEIRKIKVDFDLDKFRDKRTAIFARTGYGKSNLCKLVTSLASLTGEGLLIFDMEGEYAFRDPEKETLGLADIPQIRGNLVVYTNRKDYDASCYGDIWIHSPINLELLRPRQIASLFPEAGGEEAKAIAYFRGLFSLPDSFKDAIRNFNNVSAREREDLLSRAAESIAPRRGAQGKVDESQVGVLKRNLRWIMPLHDSTAPNIVTDAMWHLARGRTVIVDLSLLPLEIGNSLSNTILEGIFQYNVRNITQGRLIKCIAVFEEAQNVLNRDAVKEGRSYFVRWTKEGRKYRLGLIYVTQQPGAIAEEIVSQTDNFFVMHLLGKGDIDALRRANPHYDGVISEFLSKETIIGNTYIYSAPKQPYVFPCKVLEFQESTVQDLIRQEKFQPRLL
ncbi:ATP-binding protein [Dehalococcoidia bacterium]|nr:ATP-binding protein [Dehalococcoidia bacterium]